MLRKFTLLVLLALLCSYCQAFVKPRITHRATGLPRIQAEKRPMAGKRPTVVPPSKSTGSSNSKQSTPKPRSTTGSAKKPTRDPDYNPMIMYNEDLIKPWSFADSFNSTTLKFIFEIKDEFSSTWAKLEQTFASWVVVVTSKVERDIKTTVRASDFVSRKVSKDTFKLFDGVSDIAKPLIGLPSTIGELSSRNETWSLIRAGVNPLKNSRMIGNLDATNTRARAKAPRKKKSSSLSPDSLYRSVRLLPQTLQYDYERRRIAQEADKISTPMSRLLGDGTAKTSRYGGVGEEPEEGGGEIGLSMSDDEQQGFDGRVRVRRSSIPLLAAPSVSSLTTTSQSFEDEDEYQDGGPDNMSTGDAGMPGFPDASGPLKEISDLAVEGAFTALQKEIQWARTVAEETLAVETIAISSLRSDAAAAASSTKIKGDDDAVTYSVGVPDEGYSNNNSEDDEEKERDLKKRKLEFQKWNIELIQESVDILSIAEESCGRLSALKKLPEQLARLRMVVAERQQQHFEKMRTTAAADGSVRPPLSRAQLMRGLSVGVALRSGDVEAVRRGVEVLVNAVSAASIAPSGTLAIDGKFGWSGGEESVRDRVLDKRPLLAAVYVRLEGLEAQLDEQRGRQKEEAEEQQKRALRSQLRRQQADKGKKKRVSASAGARGSKVQRAELVIDEDEEPPVVRVVAVAATGIESSVDVPPLDDSSSVASSVVDSYEAADSEEGGSQQQAVLEPIIVDSAVTASTGGAGEVVVVGGGNGVITPETTATEEQDIGDDGENYVEDSDVGVLEGRDEGYFSNDSRIEKGSSSGGGDPREEFVNTLREAFENPPAVIVQGGAGVPLPEPPRPEAAKQFGNFLKQIFEEKAPVAQVEVVGESEGRNDEEIVSSSLKSIKKTTVVEEIKEEEDFVADIMVTESESVEIYSKSLVKSKEEVMNDVIADIMATEEPAELVAEVQISPPPPTVATARAIAAAILMDNGGADDMIADSYAGNGGERSPKITTDTDIYEFVDAVPPSTPISAVATVSTSSSSSNSNGYADYDDDEEVWVEDLGFNDDDDLDYDTSVLRAGGVDSDVDDEYGESDWMIGGGGGGRSIIFSTDFDFVVLTDDEESASRATGTLNQGESNLGDSSVDYSSASVESGDSGNGSGTVIETTAENAERKSEKVGKFLLTALDVTFFLAETIARTAGPILRDGGKLALSRATEAFANEKESVPKLVSRSRALRLRVRSEKAVAAAVATEEAQSGSKTSANRGYNIPSIARAQKVVSEDEPNDGFSWEQFPQFKIEKPTKERGDSAVISE